ncbi:CDP-diacylglycerol--glycerol-3-phosphate 3-phosphatidyltransferase [Candidatus Epulonipiscium viviparus]|uniref:CDP-diacylglycerol--glycerol-3-phosphate 3-phosphatidyltransferase n=1 Tax=Candidatus Epulonipiscium viviparus TaxID=420336 RepID=UPI00016C0DE8|nr:CDP-diacylglycerol--glycerol-3-phosphate 3-phosphatidyltransferase [Candidatus Epulopiscium viviparus]
MNIANKLTTLRIILVFVFMTVIWIPFFNFITTLWISLIIFIIASFTDFLDGYLARKLNLVTNLGKFMDPLADKMLVCTAMIALIDMGKSVPNGVLPAWIVVLILLREFMVSGVRLIAAGQNIIVSANMLGKIKTVVQMIMIIFYLCPYTNDFMSTTATILAYCSLVLTIVSGVKYLVDNKEVFNEK